MRLNDPFKAAPIAGKLKLLEASVGLFLQQRKGSRDTKRVVGGTCARWMGRRQIVRQVGGEVVYLVFWSLGSILEIPGMRDTL